MSNKKIIDISDLCINLKVKRFYGKDNTNSIGGYITLIENDRFKIKWSDSTQVWFNKTKECLNLSNLFTDLVVV